jgi:hypothetical protein
MIRDKTEHLGLIVAAVKPASPCPKARTLPFLCAAKYRVKIYARTNLYPGGRFNCCQNLQSLLAESRCRISKYRQSLSGVCQNFNRVS